MVETLNQIMLTLFDKQLIIFHRPMSSQPSHKKGRASTTLAVEMSKEKSHSTAAARLRHAVPES